jgi:accessory gene regulator B
MELGVNNMLNVEKLAENLAGTILSHYPNSSSTLAVLRYALIAVINFLITILLVVIITAATGDIKAGSIAIVAFPSLRYVSGGLHLKSSNICTILTAAFMLIAIYTPIEYWYTGLVLSLLSVVILAVNAPSGIKRSKLDKKYYPVLKLIALLIVCTSFVFQSHVLSVVFFIQSLTTTTFFQKLLDRFDG